MILKRIFDIVVSLTGMIVLSPLYLILIILIRVKLGSPVFFSQERPGYKGELFRMYKFRSMTDARDDSGELLPDGERLGKFGKLLRATSLDEAPELWNILKGDMSVVGPRPLLVEYLLLYDERQAKRHDVSPGFTGWAQVNGRNSLSWEERFELDVWYVENRNFWLDLKILWLTVLTVLGRKGVSAEGHVTMPKFEGSSPKSN